MPPPHKTLFCRLFSKGMQLGSARNTLSNTAQPFVQQNVAICPANSFRAFACSTNACFARRTSVQQRQMLVQQNAWFSNPFSFLPGILSDPGATKSKPVRQICYVFNGIANGCYLFSQHLLCSVFVPQQSAPRLRSAKECFGSQFCPGNPCFAQHSGRVCSAKSGCVPQLCDLLFW